VNLLVSSIWQKKFGELIDSAKRLVEIWMLLVWRITDDSPNLPNFLPAKFSRYTVKEKQKEVKSNNTSFTRFKRSGKEAG